jgi:hypothetical protein
VGASLTEISMAAIYSPADGDSVAPRIACALTHRYAYRSIRFSWDWEHAWNTHDIEAMLAHFSDEVFDTSPMLAEFFPNPVERCGVRPAYATTGRLRCNDLICTSPSWRLRRY